MACAAFVLNGEAIHVLADVVWVNVTDGMTMFFFICRGGASYQSTVKCDCSREVLCYKEEYAIQSGWRLRLVARRRSPVLC
jgi:hypothetical protein